ncbi:MAG: hypothetical protein H6Q31_2484 [Bacteroidetes bacterium]|nr:hypothetical protein [Bacteroidota bacterium]
MQAAEIRVGIALVVPGGGEAFMDRQGEIVAFKGFVVLADAAQHDPSVVPGVIIVRIPVQVFVIAPERIFKLIQVVVAVSEFIPGFPVVGVTLQYELEDLGGLFVFLHLLECHGLVKQCVFMGRFYLECAFEAAQGLLKPSQVIERDAAVNKDFGVHGVQAKRSLEGREGLFVPVEVAQNEPLLLPGVRAVRDKGEEPFHHPERFVVPLMIEEIVHQLLQRFDAGDLGGAVAVQVLEFLQFIFKAVPFPLFAVLVIETAEIQFAHYCSVGPSFNLNKSKKRGKSSD